jgi:pimeloyl-ACP methyl ester carboxylesterase
MKNLLLLHGALGHSDHFSPYLEVLSTHFKVHTFLFSGHGNTAIPAEGITMENNAAQIAAYCTEHQLDDVAIFGFSMGGYAALYYALQHPGKVNSIMTLGTKFNWTEEGAAAESKMMQPETLAAKVPKYAAQLAQQHGENNWKLLLPALSGMMTRLGKTPLLQDNLGDLNIPVQITVADKDVMVTVEESLEVYRKLQDGRLAVLPGTKHPLERVNPKLLLDAMKDFWQLP